MSERAPYSRVYWAIVDDPKFSAIYDDDRHLATWLRLLIAADALWPASAPVPGNARKASIKALVDAGLIDHRPGYRFRVHGLDAERGMRTDSARNAAAQRWHPSRSEGRITSSDARRDETRQDETTRARAKDANAWGPNRPKPSTVDRDPHLSELRAALRAKEKDDA